MAARKSSSAPCWQPNAVQATILRDLADVYEVLYAGQVGGGKTDLVVMAPLVYPEYRSAHFKGLILRHDGQDLDKEICPRTQRADMYPAYAPGARFNSNKKVWQLPQGGRIILTHAKDLMAHWGPEYQYAGWDELTHFSEEQYTWILGRLRSSVGLRIRVRAATNPPGPGRAWVRRRWGPWLDRHYFTPPTDAPPAVVKAAESLRALLPPRQDVEGRPLPPAESAQVLWYTFDEDGHEIWVPPGTPQALSRTWVMCRTEDNPALMAGDPQYRHRLKAMGALLVQQLGAGDWDVEQLPGDFFDRQWFKVQELRPAQVVGRIRRWDFAWTAKKKSDKSAGALLSWDSEGHFYLEHLVTTKGKPHEVRELVRQTAAADGIGVKVVVPVDFAAGIYVEEDLVRALAGYQVQGVEEKGTKDERIAIIQPQAQAGFVHLVAGPWVHPFLDVAAAYRLGRHGGWDELDALAGAILYAVGEGGKILTEEQAAALRQAQQRIAAAGKNYDQSGWGRMHGSTWGRGRGSSWSFR